MSLRGPVASNGLRQLGSEGHSDWDREAAGFREGAPGFPLKLVSAAIFPGTSACPQLGPAARGPPARQAARRDGRGAHAARQTVFSRLRSTVLK